MSQKKNCFKSTYIFSQREKKKKVLVPIGTGNCCDTCYKSCSDEDIRSTNWRNPSWLCRVPYKELGDHSVVMTHLFLDLVGV